MGGCTRYTQETSAAANQKRWQKYKQPAGNKSLVAKTRVTMPDELLTFASLNWSTKAGRRITALVDQYKEHYCRNPNASQSDKMYEAAFLGLRMENMAARALLGEPIDDALYALLLNVQRRTLNSL